MEDDDFVVGKKADFPITILENGIKYAVNLNEGAMTGIFLDQKDVRKTIRDQYAKGRNVLNTFLIQGLFRSRQLSVVVYRLLVLIWQIEASRKQQIIFC